MSSCCLPSSYVDPSVADFKAYYPRDFIYGTANCQVTDADIAKALADTAYFINPALFCSQADYTLGFLTLAAHFLVVNMRASSQGISGSYTWLANSKSVGSVSESFSIPQRILDNPMFAMLAQTNYGAKYLFLVLPKLTGVMFSVYGRTHA